MKIIKISTYHQILLSQKIEEQAIKQVGWIVAVLTIQNALKLTHRKASNSLYREYWVHHCVTVTATKDRIKLYKMSNFRKIFILRQI